MQEKIYYYFYIVLKYNISESNGIYTLTLNEDRVFTLGGYIYFEGVDINNTINQNYLDKLMIHTIHSVSPDFLSITIELESGLDIPSFVMMLCL